MEIPNLPKKKHRLKHTITTLALLSGLAALPVFFQSSSGETSSEPPMPPIWSVLEDADQDGMTDADELLWGMDPFNTEDGLSDLDGDEISLAWEFAIGTNPSVADTDMDGWSDSEEYLLFGTDPLDFFSFPLDGAPEVGEGTTAESTIPEPTAALATPPSLSNGDFSGVSITTWQSMESSTEYQGKGFVWNAGTVGSWTAYVGSTVEVWDAGGEKFVELDGSPGNYGIKQPIKDAKAGGYVLAWRESGRHSAKAGDDPYSVRVYYLNGSTEVPIAQSAEFTGLDEMHWTDKAFAFQITPEQLAAAKGTPIYVAFIPTGSSLNTYGTLIDKVSLLSVGIVAHKRGTFNTPGPNVSPGTGEYGYETVMMENANAQDNTEGKPDYDTTGDLSTLGKQKDNDLVKIVLYYTGPILPGTSLELIHEGMEVDATKKTAEEAIATKSTGSRMNFYSEEGKLLSPAVDLKIDNFSNPGTNYLSKILDAQHGGKLILFVEGAKLFGFQGGDDGSLPRGEYDKYQTVDGKMNKLGGARIKLKLTHGNSTAEAPVLIYRGGFLVFKEPKESGTPGNFEFWDGKGRVRNEVGNPIYKNEFKKDDTDWGAILKTWKVKSGQLSGDVYNVKNGGGPTPPGWWFAVENSVEGAESQTNKKWKSGVGKKEKWNQSPFCRWKQDDETDKAKRYENTYEYDGSIAKDFAIGIPTYIEFKFRLFPISPSTKQNRTNLLIHPDGKKNGTLGCIGIQSYSACEEIHKTLINYHGLKIKIQTN